ncbi:polyphosphate:AMP phosphotransferase [bacterium]|nr:polyphosphate:AMP phosphotransferase [bacterium]
MLEKADLSRKISKTDYRTLFPELETRLGIVQRAIKENRIPVIILFEGWGAAGKGTMINKLSLAMDPRGFQVYSPATRTEDDQFRPYLWRFWSKIPAVGRIAIFDRSWYGQMATDDTKHKTSARKQWQLFESINAFEQTLVEGGYSLIKFFLHISRKEQQKRFRKQENNPATDWKVTKADWQANRHYKTILESIEHMLAHTETEFGPWTIVEAHDWRYASIKIFTTIIEQLDRALRNKADADNLKNHITSQHRIEPKPGSTRKKKTVPVLSSSILARVDLSHSLERPEYEESLEKYQDRVRELEFEVYRKRVPVVIVYEGYDAAGKGGNIRRLVQGMDPRGYDVVPIGAPNDIEKAHHYLWRFWKEFPKAGHIAIFDRSWYGRVMVERIEGFCSEQEWKRAYREINDMEKQWTSFGTVIIKFWLHIDQDEQLKRFKERELDVNKKWKITEEDWRNREKWDLYTAAVDEMLQRTSTAYAPWTIIESNSKWYARIKALKTVITALEKALGRS